MLARLRAQFTYANVVATLALFLALGGASYAAIRVTSGSIVNNTVRTQDLRNNDVRSRDIRNRTIVARDILSNQITGLLVRESSLSKVPDSDSLDGQDSTVFKVKCPAGTTAHAGACIETTARPAQAFRAAARTCGVAGRRLPSFGELDSYRQEPGVVLASGGSSIELTGDVVDAGATNEIAAILASGADAKVDFIDSERFRCVAPLSN